jgi:hypothetical protein
VVVGAYLLLSHLLFETAESLGWSHDLFGYVVWPKYVFGVLGLTFVAEPKWPGRSRP